MIINKKKSFKLSTIYPFDKETNTYCVYISLDSYEELFNGWDAAPIKRRDLEPDLLDFLEQVSYDIPLSEKVKIVFQLPEAKKDSEKEQRSKEAIYHNFNLIRHFINKSLMQNNRKIATYLAMGVFFLLLSYSLDLYLHLTFPFSILVDGFFIGGWVMFWEAFSLTFFIGHEFRNRRNRFARYSDSQVEFQYFSSQPISIPTDDML